MFNRCLAVLALIAGLAASPAAAQDAASRESGEGDVIARVNGDAVYESDLISLMHRLCRHRRCRRIRRGGVDVTAVGASAIRSDATGKVSGEAVYVAYLISLIQRLPPQLQAQVQLLMPQILDQLVNNKLTTQAGHAAGLAEDAEVKAQMAKIEDLIVGQIFLQRAVDARVTEEKIEAAYQDFLKENPPQPALKARHILVETEDEASGANGGELPPFQAGQMVPEFSDAAFAMEVGTHSSEPVKTQFGFHVIKVEESRMTEPPTKADMEDQLREQLSQSAVEEVYAELRDGAEIEVLFGQQPDNAPATQGDTPPAASEDAPAPSNN